MRNVKIFLASSAELDEDKIQFDLYFSEKNKIYRNRNIDFNQKTWKDFVSSVSMDRLQDRYNEYIKKCDIAIFLFHTRQGKYTLEELDIAHRQFCRSHGKKPLIFIFVKEDKLYQEFQQELKEYSEKELGHFCDTYASYEDLWIKFDKQLQLLENSKFIKPDPIDVPRVIRFVALNILTPLIILTLGILIYIFFRSNSISVRLVDIMQHTLPFEGGEVTLQYGGKSETLPVRFLEEEILFKEIHTRYRWSEFRFILESPGYYKLDTVIKYKDHILLPIRRDRSYGIIKGEVMDESGNPIEGADVNVIDLHAYTDRNGEFELEIPSSQQTTTYRLKIRKKGYEIWDYEGIAPSDKETTKIILDKL